MDLDELRTVHRTERQKDSLQSLRDSFYEDAADYLEEMTAERNRAAERAEDPFGSEEVRRLTDRVEAAEDIAEAVYECRVGKIVKRASLAAADMSVDTGSMTAQERNLFDDLVARIRDNKSTVFDILTGDGAPAPDAGTDPGAGETAPGAAEAGPATDDVLAEAMGGDEAATAGSSTAPTGPESSATGDDAGPATASPGAPDDPGSTRDAEGSGAAAPDGTDDGERTPVEPEPGPPGDAASPETPAGNTERTTVRITDDVGSILGADEREYDLEREDVVTLPATNAGPLLERGAAEKLD